MNVREVALSVMDENKPNTDKLGLETVGLKPGDWLDIDDTCLVKG